MSARGRGLLLSAGLADAAIAFFHLGVIAVGAPAYRYFGAGEGLVRKAEEGSILPAALTTGAAGVFVLFAAYAFSAAGMLTPLPRLRAALVSISVIYLLRGLSALPQGIALARAPELLPPRFFLFSLVALAVGLLHAAGTARTWRWENGDSHLFPLAQSRRSSYNGKR